MDTDSSIPLSPESTLCAYVKMFSADLILTVGAIYAGDKKPTKLQMEMLRYYSKQIDEAIDKYEIDKEPEATIRTADGEHQLDIEDGVASFEAYRNAKREVVS